MFVSLGICNKAWFFQKRKMCVWSASAVNKNAYAMNTFFRQSLVFASKRLHSYIVSWKLIQLILQSLLHFFKTKLEFVLNRNNNNNNGKTTNSTSTTTTTILVVKCVTWFLNIGRPGETSEYRLLLLWTKAAMMLDWGSSTLDITAAGIVGISYSLCGFGYCTVLMLAVLTDIM